jgi:hypothetical protein
MCPGKTGRREKKEIMLQIKPVNKPLVENRVFSMISIDKRERICYNCKSKCPRAVIYFDLIK